MRKSLVIIAVLLMCAVMFTTFVACDNNSDGAEDDKGVVLTSDMTADQIREALKGVKNFTMSGYSGDTLKYFENGFSIEYSEGENSFSESVIFENNIQYTFTSNNNDIDVTIIDCTGYDVEGVSVTGATSVIDSMLNENDFKVVDGQLIIYDNYVVKDYNCTEMFIPEQYKNYSSLEPNATVLEFEDKSDSECKLSAINVALRSLTVPEKYEGKTVTEICSIIDNVPTQISFSTTITELGELSLWGEQAITIEYAGTKEQWAKIQKIEHEWTPSNKLIIQCSDGIIENVNQAE